MEFKALTTCSCHILGPSTSLQVLCNQYGEFHYFLIGVHHLVLRRLWIEYTQLLRVNDRVYSSLLCSLGIRTIKNMELSDVWWVFINSFPFWNLILLLEIDERSNLLFDFFFLEFYFSNLILIVTCNFIG
jgi:hypothetical protein